jgi:N-methylhydantoinase B
MSHDSQYGSAVTAPEVDVLLAPVLQRRVEGIAKEMASMLLRSSRSVIFNELADFVTVVFDAAGRTLAQTDHAPILAFGAQPSLEYILDYFGDEIYEGDVVIHNDVYMGSNQNADVGVFVPIFHEHQLVGWAGAKGHVADIGGATPGGYNPSHKEVWQEALRISPLKLYERGIHRRDVWDFLAANIRFAVVMEDFKSMIGACYVGRNRLLEVIDRYGADSFKRHMQYVMDSSEQQVRDVIREWPDGVYRGESWMTSDGVNLTRRYRIAVKVTIEGDGMTFDFSESADQAPGFTNMPEAAARGAVRVALLMMLASGGLDIPTNQALFAPAKVILRKGSIMSPEFPAATIFGNQMGEQVVEAINLALAEAIPDRVSAGWHKLLPIGLVGTDPRSDEPFVVFTLFQRGGSGALLGTDGWNCIGSPSAICVRSPDPEMFELTTPHLLEYVELLEDSGGAGESRGGLGVSSAFRVDGRDEFLVTLGHETEHEGGARPSGLFGGEDGGLNDFYAEFPDGRIQPIGSKVLIELAAGTRVVASSGGGSGYGDPKRRPVELVLADVRDGLVSLEAARDVYGVVIDAETWSVIEDETASLRSSKVEIER